MFFSKIMFSNYPPISFQDLFLKLASYCSSVLCCRATPLQKAYIVRIVKEELKVRTETRLRDKT